VKIIIHDELTDLNTYIRKERGNRFVAAHIKEEETFRVYLECKTQKVPPVHFPVFVECHWFCKNKRKDKDNIAFGKKFILDGLVKAGVLSDDTWKMIVGFRDEFFIDNMRPRVEVYLHETDNNQHKAL